MADEPKMANEMQNTFQFWASLLLHHAGVDSDDEDVPWKPRGHWPEECDQSCACCRAHNFEDVECFWSGCEMCLDGWSLSNVNRHQRTLLREYVRSVQASASAVEAAVVPAAIVPVRMTYVTSYRCENAAYDMNCFLYIFEEPGRDDLIAFSSPWGMTRFHGSVQRHQFNIMALRFHCRGQTEHLRHVLLMRIANNPAVWDGFDYQGRHITMTEIRRYYWHQQAALWVVL